MPDITAIPFSGRASTTHSAMPMSCRRRWTPPSVAVRIGLKHSDNSKNPGTSKRPGSTSSATYSARTSIRRWRRWQCWPEVLRPPSRSLPRFRDVAWTQWETGRMELRVAHLYPDVMNIYGDRGNVIALRYRCEASGIDFALTEVNIGDPFDPADFDVVLIGGGQDREQRRIADDLAGRGPAIRQAIDGGMPALAVCGGFQLFGHRYVDQAGGVIPGISVFDLETRHPGPVADRSIGDVVLE